MTDSQDSDNHDQTVGVGAVPGHPARRRRSHGRLWIFLSGLSLVFILALMAGFFLLILWNSAGALWPTAPERLRLHNGDVLMGLRVQSEQDDEGKPRTLYKVGNRDVGNGADYVWVNDGDVEARDYPAGAAVVERYQNGLFLGFLAGGTDGNAGPEEFSSRLRSLQRDRDQNAQPLLKRLEQLGDLWQAAHLRSLRFDYEAMKAKDPAAKAAAEQALVESRAREEGLKADSQIVMTAYDTEKTRLGAATAHFRTADGKDVALPLASIVDVTWPGGMGVAAKALRFCRNIWTLLSTYPREANSEGGLFPALFGTVLLVFIMAVTAFPLGVAAGVYLREYARDGLLARAARVAVGNLAGVPSIVYGIFGLGFFVYGCGGAVDRLLYPERVAAGINTFGGGGILWSSLTLGLLTLPVVIVATEEALQTVPPEVRQGSLALGATRFQTIWHVALPMAGPGILTGFILAMARAAGEVAPLMLTGAVKSAQRLAVDGQWPFVHLDRKFMHLGFHIYDMAFQSPNVMDAKPLVYLTALVLLVLVFALNLSAIVLRKRLRDKYTLKGF